MRLSLVVIILFLVSCSSKSNDEIQLPFYSDPTYTPVWDAKSPHSILPFALVNQDSSRVDTKCTRGKIYVANFFFTTCPSLCPRLTKNLHRVQKAFIDDENVLILSHSVTPWIDDVKKLSAYAKRNEINAKTWHLLTGTKKEIYTLARGGYFADEGFGKQVTLSSDFLHTENIWLVDTKGHIRGVYNGTLPLEMTRLIEDIYTLKKLG